MRYSLLAATLIAFGTTVAMPANACCVQQQPNASVPGWVPQMQKDAGETVMPQMQKDDHVTMGIAGTTNSASSELA